MVKIMRAWDRGKNKVAYVYRDPETGRTKIGEEHFDWFFYVQRKYFIEHKSFFLKLEEDGLVNKYDLLDRYVKIFVDREHKSDFLQRDMQFCWEYYDKKKNYILKLLEARKIPHCEADLSVAKRWIISNSIEFESDYRVLYWDIETDDSKLSGQPIPGEFQILSISVLDAQTNKGAWLCCKDWGIEHEKEMLSKFLRLVSNYDVLCGWNSSNFDLPYLRCRMELNNLEIDFRKKFFQDQLFIIRKHGQKLQSYSLENVSQYYLKRGKIKHSERIFQMFNNNKKLLKEYNMEDCQLMYDIEKKTKLLETSRGVNTIGLCPCDDIYVSRKIDNIVLRQSDIDNNYHFKTVVKNNTPDEENEDEEFEGAFVFPPKIGVHSDVKVLDFTATYPNVIITSNASPDTLITEENQGDVKEDQIIYNPSGNKFRKDFIGIFPKIVLNLTNERDKFEKIKKDHVPGSLEYEINDNLAYVYKSLGLSVYGAIGLKTSRFYDIRVAESITLGAQFFIKKVAEYFERQNIPVLYGDSDSLFISLKKDELIPKIIENIRKLCDYFAKKEWKSEKCTISMGNDKTFKKFIIIAKKRYAGMLNSVKGKYLTETKLSIKGLEFVRTDQCQLVKRKQEELLKNILSEKIFTDEEAIKFIESLKKYVFSNEIILEDIKLSQKLTKNIEDYKSKTMHIKVAEEMKIDGKEFYVGDKLEYFIIGMDSKNKPIPCPIYKWDGRFARVYYWANKIFPPFLRLLEVSNPKVNWERFSMNELGKNQNVGRMDLW